MKLSRFFLVAAMFAGVHSPAQQNGASIDVPDGVQALLTVKGEGVQIYTCTQGEKGQNWVLKGPNAKLMAPGGDVVGTHFAGPTWKMNDGGVVQGQLVASKPSPDPGSVPWLLLRAKPGTATGSLGSVTFIRRAETHGGVAGAAGCEGAGDIGKTVEVPYSATYTFYVPK